MIQIYQKQTKIKDVSFLVLYTHWKIKAGRKNILEEEEDV